MKCPVCGFDSWRDLDYLRNPEYWWNQNLLVYPEKVNFGICTFCGFISYPKEKMNDAERKAVYDGPHYRRTVHLGQIVACNRKWLMHEKLYGRLYDPAKRPRVLDVGMAQGYLLTRLRKEKGYKPENLYGTEFTRGYVNWAVHIGGVLPSNVGQEINPAWGKFDIINLFHVFEHVSGPREKLMQYRDMLTEDGRLCISVPMWNVDNMDHKGDAQPGYNFEEYFHIFHVNCWSPQSLKNIFSEVGLEVEKWDDQVYDVSVVLKKCEPKLARIVQEDVDAAVKRMEAIKASCEAMKADRPDEAVKLFPGNVHAWILLSMWKENFRDPEARQRILDDACKMFPNCHSLAAQRAINMMQVDGVPEGTVPQMTSQIAKAEELMDAGAQMHIPTEDYLHRKAIISYIYRHNPLEAVDCWLMAMQLNPGRAPDYWGFIGEAIAGVPLSTNRSQQEKLGTEKTNVSILAVPRLKGIARDMGEKV